MDAPSIFATLELATKIGELGTKLFSGKEAQVLKEHVALLRSHLELNGKQQAETEGKLRKTEARVAELEAELAAKWMPFRGALFLRLPSGRVDDAVYCPACRVAAIATTFAVGTIGRDGEGVLHSTPSRYKCMRTGCGWQSDFVSGKQEALLAAVALEYGCKIREVPHGSVDL